MNFELFFLQKQYPLEAHLVHFNTALGSSAAEASSASRGEGGGGGGGLAVLGVLFEVREEDNKEMEAIFKGEGDQVSRKTILIF